jgi:hypothetical protein
MTQRQRGKKAADLFLMSPEHYAAFEASLVGQQRIVNESGWASGLHLAAVNRRWPHRRDRSRRRHRIEHAGEHHLRHRHRQSWMRYHPERNFDKIGRSMMPINQDAVVQYIGFMGELTMTNPLFQWKLYDSNPAA